MEESLIAPCGMNCGLCVSYLAMKNDLNQKGFSKKYCPGCIPRGRNCVHMADSCKTLGHGKLRFCHQCPDFPCVRLKSLDKRYRTKYHMSMIENLHTIRDNGMVSFLHDEADKWACPKCGGVICCHNGLCLTCNAETLRQNKGYHWKDTPETQSE